MDKEAKPYVFNSLLAIGAELTLGTIIMAWLGGCLCFRYCSCWKKPGYEKDGHVWVSWEDSLLLEDLPDNEVVIGDYKKGLNKVVPKPLAGMTSMELVSTKTISGFETPNL